MKVQACIMHPEPRQVPLCDRAHAPIRTTILVVDDEVTILQLLRDILEDEGYAVLMAKDGQEGFDLALEHHPNLILTDLMMPRMKGDALITQVMQDPDPIPCILMSAYHTDVTLLPVPFLSKPFAITDLEQLVAAALLPPAAQTETT